MSMGHCTTDICQVLAQAFEKHKLGFMTLKQFIRFTPASERKRLGLTKSGNIKQDDIKSALTPLPETYRCLKYKNSQYLVRNIPDSELLVSYIQTKRSKTFGQLNQHFPLKKNELIKTVNSLLEKGLVKAQLSSTEKIVLYPSATTVTAQKDSRPVLTAIPQADAESFTADKKAFIIQFRQAYHTVSKGSDYVFIHHIRRQLKWPRSQFDKMLDTLMVEGYLAAHPGNPGDLATDEAEDAYQDEFGDLYITVSWRKAV